MTNEYPASGPRSFERSLWHATGDETPGSMPVEPDSSFDFVIVGGGIAGAVAFATLARAGARVALFEADRLGSGATGRSGGFVVPAFPARSPVSVLQEGGAKAEALVAAVAGAPERVFSLARQLDIDCAALKQAWYHPAVTAGKMQALEADAEVWRRFGSAVEVLDASETEQQTGVRGYVGSCRFESAGTIHPLKFVHGLVRAAVARGGCFRERSPVLSLERNGRRWLVVTPDGKVTADQVMVCTNGQSRNLSPALARSLLRVTICQSASHPVAEPDRRHLFGQGSCLSDSRVNLFTYRFDPEWRLISGSFPLLGAGSGSRLGDRMARRLRKELRLPSPLEQQFVWFGKASITEDLLPRICQVGPGAYSLTSCNGRGLAQSSMLALHLSTALLKGSLSDLPLLPADPKPYRRRTLAGLGARLYPAYGAIADRLSAAAR